MSRVTFTTGAQSYTGSILYSDTHCFHNKAQHKDKEGHIYSSENLFGAPHSEGDELISRSSVSSRTPGLNVAARIPIIGIFAGVCRVALSIIHIISHLFLALIKWDRGHLFHVVKGGAEFLRGLIEMIPIIGRIFVWKHDFSIYDPEDFEGAMSIVPPQGEAVFLVKILNPGQFNGVDRLRFQSARA